MFHVILLMAVSNRTLILNAMWSLVGHVLSRGSLMLTAILLARGLEAREFAEYSYFQITVSMLSTYAALGLGTTASRFFAEVEHNKSSKNLPPLGTLLSLSLLMALISVFLIWILPAHWLNAGFGIGKYLLALGVAATVLGVVPSGGILGLEGYRAAALTYAVSGIIFLLGAWWSVHRGSPLMSMWAIVVGTALRIVGEMVVVGYRTGWRRLLGTGMLPNRNDLKRVASYAGPMFFVSILAGSGSWLIGRIILTTIDGKSTFAVYSIGLQWYALGIVIPGMISRVLLPKFVRSKADTPSVLKRGIILATIPVAIMFGLALLFNNWIIAFYGTNYANQGWIIPGFLLAALFISPVNAVGNALVAHDYQFAWLQITVISFFLLLGAGWILRDLGACASVIAYCAFAFSMLLMSLFFAKRRYLL